MGTISPTCYDNLTHNRCRHTPNHYRKSKVCEISGILKTVRAKCEYSSLKHDHMSV